MPGVSEHCKKNESVAPSRGARQHGTEQLLIQPESDRRPDAEVSLSSLPDCHEPGMTPVLLRGEIPQPLCPSQNR